MSGSWQRFHTEQPLVRLVSESGRIIASATVGEYGDYLLQTPGPFSARFQVINGWIERWLAPLLSGKWLLIVPSLLFGLYRLTLLPSFPSTHALFGDWYNHALFASVFLLGFLLAHAASFWEAIERRRWIAR